MTPSQAMPWPLTPNPWARGWGNEKAAAGEESDHCSLCTRHYRRTLSGERFLASEARLWVERWSSFAYDHGRTEAVVVKLK